MQETADFTVYNASAGSGKTFTLVLNYLKILFKTPNPNRFQQILAITFTNKAAAEMKDRVMETLRDIALGNENHIKDILESDLNLPAETLKERASKILNALIQHYSQFNVHTIDTFTHRLVRTFAIDLGLSVNFDVELDIETRLKEAVERVIDKVGVDEHVTRILIDYALEQTDEDKSWDISSNLYSLGKVIFNEDSIPHLKKLQSKSISDFLAFKQKLFGIKKSIEKQFYALGTEGLSLIDEQGIKKSSFSYRGALPSLFIKFTTFGRLATEQQKINFSGNLGKIMEKKNLTSAKCDAEDKAKIHAIGDRLLSLCQEAEILYKKVSEPYFLTATLLKSLSSLAVLNQLNTELHTIKEQDNIQFLGEFNRIIHKHLSEQPAAYIYERIGEKFKHYFIDEMQDTSVLQWKNLIPLIDNALSQGDSGLLLVGDAKQSIYRWRGGKPEQFICLASEKRNPDNCNPDMYNPFSIEKKVKSLDTNYRSFSEIIDFNNRFFTNSTKYFIKDSHAELYKAGNRQLHNSKSGGFVQLHFFEAGLKAEELDENVQEKTLKIIKNLDGKIKRSDICVLVRKRDQGEKIAAFLSENSIAIESSESLLLKNNPDVQFILNLLRYLDKPDDLNPKFTWLQLLYEKLELTTGKHRFISKMIDKTPEQSFEILKQYGWYYDVSKFSQTPLYDNIERIIRSFKLNAEPNAYVQFFLEEVLKFTLQQSQSLTDFLNYWDLKEDKISISASENETAVKISTIHKAKGLQYRVVIVPYQLDLYDISKESLWLDISGYNYNSGFESFYVKAGSKLEMAGETAKSEFLRKKQEAELDNLNLLYVAFTRSVEQLYIFAQKKKKKQEIKTTDDLLRAFLEDSGIWSETQNSYTFGNPEPAVSEKREISAIEYEIQKTMNSTAWEDLQITIVPSTPVFEDAERKKAVDFGNLIHQIMEQVITSEDLIPVINRFVHEGLLSAEEKSIITAQLQQLVQHPKLHTYFKPGNSVFTERELVDAHRKVHKPDRLNFTDEKHVVIIDYKTGLQEAKHTGQLQTYADVLKSMGYIIKKALLVYIDNNIQIKSLNL